MEENYLSHNIKNNQDCETLIESFKIPKTEKDTSNLTMKIQNFGLIKNEDKASKFTQTDVEKLCEQLKAFNTRLQSARDIIALRFNLPMDLHNKLEAETEELMCLHAELQSAKKHIEVIRNQRLALRMEKLTMESELTKLKSEAAQELEVIVSVYDKAMLENWHKVKASNSVHNLENFTQDVKGKMEAMKNLQTLAIQKLQDLKNKEKKIYTTSKEKKKYNRKKRDRDTLNAKNGDELNITDSSRTSLQLLLDTDSEEGLERASMHSMLYSLVRGHMSEPLSAWEQDSFNMDLD